MKKYLKKIKEAFTTDRSKTVFGGVGVSSANARSDDAIKFTLKTYGETFRDLAKYDRGEKLSH